MGGNVDSMRTVQSVSMVNPEEMIVLQDEQKYTKILLQSWEVWYFSPEVDMTRKTDISQSSSLSMVTVL